MDSVIDPLCPATDVDLSFRGWKFDLALSTNLSFISGYLFDTASLFSITTNEYWMKLQEVKYSLLLLFRGINNTKHKALIKGVLLNVSFEVFIFLFWVKNLAKLSGTEVICSGCKITESLTSRNSPVKLSTANIWLFYPQWNPPNYIKVPLILMELP